MNISEKLISLAYNLTLLMLTLSGFGQMPIFSRYYLAKIPGFGWLGEFYVTHIIHYIFAGIMIALTLYVFTNFLIRGRLWHLTVTGILKSVTLAWLIISGSLLMINNLSGVYLNHTFINILNIAHLTLCMILLLISLYTLIAQKKMEKW
jgi:hypothetical protein